MTAGNLFYYVFCSVQGEHCERCTDGFFGKPVNGGDCRKCECNGQGSLCDHR